LRTRRLRDRFVQALAPRLGAFLIRGLRRLMRLEYRRPGQLRGMVEGGERLILAFWHGHLLMMPYSYPGKRISALISEHHDGELIARTLLRMGFGVSRGSTTSGGARALRQMVRLVREGWDIAITPDGPRGPRHQVQPGAIELARLTGAPIVPVAFGASKKKLCAPGIAS
jgi:hypothetical protein